jgi:hypothetical protein
MLPKVKSEGSNATDNMKRVGQMWKSLGKSDQEVYQKKAKLEKERMGLGAVTGTHPHCPLIKSTFSFFVPEDPPFARLAFRAEKKCLPMAR